MVTSQAADAEAFDATEPVKVRRVPGRSALGNHAGVLSLNGAALLEARRFKPDVTLSAHIVASPSAWAISRLRGTPFVQYLHGHEVACRPHLTRFALTGCKAAIAVSRHTEELARACGARPRRLLRVPPGVDLADALPVERTRTPVVVTTARLDDRYKGHDILIRALPLVRRRVPDVTLAIIGDGRLRAEYEQLAYEHGVGHQVRFLGAVSDAERDAWLRRARVFALLSRLPAGGGGEGFGIAYLEAAVHGLPVVAGNVGGALDAVVDGHTGVLVDPTDQAAVAAVITDLLVDPGRAESLGRAGAERAREFAWPRIARQVEDVLLQIASPPAPQS